MKNRRDVRCLRASLLGIEKGVRREARWAGKKKKEQTILEEIERVVGCRYTTYGLQVHPVRHYSVVTTTTTYMLTIFSRSVGPPCGLSTAFLALLMVLSARCISILKRFYLSILVIPLSPLISLASYDYSCICIQERTNLLGSCFFADGGGKNENVERETEKSFGPFGLIG